MEGSSRETGGEVRRPAAGAHRGPALVGGLLVAAILLLLPPPEGLEPVGWRAAAVAVLMATWWIASALPVAVTALVPLVAFPLLGIQGIQEAAAPYAHHVVFLMLGGFVLAHAVERVGLHQRLAALLLAPAPLRATPARVLLALMAAAALLSGLVSNTATMVTLVPLALALADHAGQERARPAFLLGLAYACNIGGVGTLVGTPPNAVLAGMAGGLGREVGFAAWLGVGLPFVALALPLAWWLVARRLPPPAPGAGLAAPRRPAARAGERTVLGVLAGALILWLTRRPLDLGAWTIPGWSSILPAGVTDAWVAVAAALLLLALPRRTAGTWEPLLVWEEVERAIPWSVLLLLGGGFSLASGIASSGLSAWVAGHAGALARLPLPLATLGICLVVTFLTELTSNTATTQLSLPLLGAAAAAGGIDPLLWMVPATLSASCAFMMPVATPPNAIAVEVGGVPPGTMARTGLVLNLLCALLATAVALLRAGTLA